MPIYEYFCAANDQTVEVVHSMKVSLETWGELCDHAGIDPGDTPKESSVERLIMPTGINTPKGNADLKNIGFTKLVKRDEGVYENVTAGPNDKRYMNKGDASSIPNLKGKISD